MYLYIFIAILIYYNRLFFQEKYSRIKTLYDAIGYLDHKKMFYTLIETFTIIFKMYWYSFIQKYLNLVHQHDKNHVTLDYTVNGKLYKIMLKMTRGPPPVTVVFNENDDDVTDIVVPYMGCEYNWHHKNFTPAFWGYKKLVFEMSDMDSFTFTEHENITL